ncbi:hypothetical protein [uncultured Bilophila sp.]|uniref:hypothetical protein n=1 Tax=uncultured Bilophila sp. TaxID=529385 RepID=UPI00266F609D|nr:hypothetical protein [uncultured Bilophila sp.]
MLDVLKPDLVIVRGLTLFKQLWLPSENGITMLDPGLCPYVLRSRRMSASATATTRGISAMFPNIGKGRTSENGISAAPPPGLIQAPAYIRVPPPGWGNICLFDMIKRDHLSFKLVTASFPLDE